MKKVIRLTESDLIRIVKRVINEERYGSFGNLKRSDFKGDEWVRDDDKRLGDEELYGIGDENEFDTEEFDDFESYDEKYPSHSKESPSWFKGRQGKSMFDLYKNKTKRPFKVKTRKNRD